MQANVGRLARPRTADEIVSKLLTLQDDPRQGEVTSAPGVSAVLDHGPARRGARRRR